MSRMHPHHRNPSRVPLRILLNTPTANSPTLLQPEPSISSITTPFLRIFQLYIVPHAALTMVVAYSLPFLLLWSVRQALFVPAGPVIWHALCQPKRESGSESCVATRPVFCAPVLSKPEYGAPSKRTLGLSEKLDSHLIRSPRSLISVLTCVTMTAR